MKPNQLATLVLRLLGIYCFVQAVPLISVAITAVSFAQASPMHGREPTSALTLIALGLLPFLCRLVLGTLLLAYSIPWGEKLTAKGNDAGNIAAISFEKIQVLAFAVAGVLIFSDALPQLLNNIFSFFASLHQVTDRSQPPAYAEFNARTLLIAVGTLLKAALGLWLFFGAHGFANFWRSMRNVGTPKPMGN